MTLPDFYLLGAQKSGSTFVHFVLRNHPEIYMPKEEISTFESPSSIELKKLSKKLSKHKGQSLLGIKRPNYLGNKYVPQRIRRVRPDAKFIVILRNPSQRAVSAYFHQMKMGLIPVQDIEKGMKRIIRGDYQHKLKNETIINFGFYYKHLNNYFKYFNKNQFKIILFEEMRSKPEETIKDICRFLGVNDDFAAINLKRIPQKGIYSITRLKFINLVKNLLYTYHPKTMGITRKKQNLAEKALTLLVYGIDDIVLRHLVNNDPPKLSRKLKKQLVELYLEDIKKLEKLLNVNLSAWRSVFNLFLIHSQILFNPSY